MRPIKIIRQCGYAAFLALSLLTTALLPGCASAVRSEYYTFSYDSPSDSPGIEILDFQYGDNAMLRATDWQKKHPEAIQGGIFNGSFGKGGVLHVRWRIKVTGEEFEDKVDLTRRLPLNLTGYRIHFVIVGKQLFVYLIYPESRSTVTPANGPERFSHRKVVTIYPDQSQFNQ